METIILRVRKTRYKTQGEFARAANLRQSEISQIENGLMKLGAKRRARVADALDTAEELLFNEQGYPKLFGQETGNPT